MWTTRSVVLLVLCVCVLARSRSKRQGHTHRKQREVSKFAFPAAQPAQKVRRYNIPAKEEIKLNNVVSPEEITIVKKSGALIDSELPGAFGDDEELTDFVEGSGLEEGSGSGHSVSDIMKAARNARRRILEKKAARRLTHFNKDDVSAKDAVDVAADKEKLLLEEEKKKTDEAKSSGEGETTDDERTTEIDAVDEKKIMTTSSETNNEAGKFGNNYVPAPGINPSAAYNPTSESTKAKNTGNRTKLKAVKKNRKKKKKSESVNVELSLKGNNAINKIKIGYVDFLKSHYNDASDVHVKKSPKKTKTMSVRKAGSEHLKSSQKDDTHPSPVPRKKDSDIILQIQNIAKQIDAVEKKNEEEKKKLNELRKLKIMKSVEAHGNSGSGDEGSAEEDELKPRRKKKRIRNSKRRQQQIKKIVKKIENDIKEFSAKKNASAEQYSFVQANRDKLFGKSNEEELEKKVAELKAEVQLENDTNSISRGEAGSPEGFECPWVCYWTCHSYCPKECCNNPFRCKGVCRTFCTPYCSDRCCAPGSRRLPKLKLSFQTPAETGKAWNNKNKTMLEEKIEKQSKMLEENQKLVGEVEAVKQAESYAAELLGMPRDCPLFCNKICAPGLCAQDCCEKSTILSYLNQEKNLLAQAMKYKKQLSMLPKPQLDALLAQQYSTELAENAANTQPQAFNALENDAEETLHDKQIIATQAPAPATPTLAYTQPYPKPVAARQHTHPKPVQATIPPQTRPAYSEVKPPQTLAVQNYMTAAAAPQALQTVPGTPAPRTSPFKTPPVHTAPAHTVPAHTAPLGTQAGRTAPVNTAPVRTAPVHTPAQLLPPVDPFSTKPNAFVSPAVPLPQQQVLTQAKHAPKFDVAAQYPEQSLAPAQLDLSNDQVQIPPQLSAIFPFLSLSPEPQSNDIANVKSVPPVPNQLPVKPPYPNVKAPSIANRLNQNLAYYRPNPSPAPQVPRVNQLAASTSAPAVQQYRVMQTVTAEVEKPGQSNTGVPGETTVYNQQITPQAKGIPAALPPPPAPAAAPPPAPLSPAAAVQVPPAHFQPVKSQEPKVLIDKMKPFQVGGLLFTPEITLADPNEEMPPGTQTTKIDPPSAPAAIQSGKPLPSRNSFCPTPINCPPDGIVDPDYCPPICRSSCIEQCPNECCPNYGRPDETK